MLIVNQLRVKGIKTHIIMRIPPAIIFINGDITYPPTLPAPQILGIDPSLYIGADPAQDELTKLQGQLQISETMTKQEFDARVAADPNYPAIVRLQYLRILVILDSFHDLVNRNLADVVIFVKQGIASIEKNNFGKHGLSLDMQRLNIYELLRYNRSKNVVIVPDFGEHYRDRDRDRDSGAFGEIDDHGPNHKLYKIVPENQPGKPPHDDDEGE
jgi:hypothetical protein